MARIEKAIILAAGEGQRLKPFTAGKPKVMIPIANKPILRYVIEALVNCGIRSIIIIVGYKKEKIQDYVGSGTTFGAEIKYIDQKQQLGTAHALRQVRDVSGERFLVLSGDNIIESDTIAGLLEAESPGVVVKEQENLSKYGAVLVRDNRVTEIVEKPEKSETNLVNTGIYVFNKKIFQFIEGEVDLPAAINSMLKQGDSLLAYETGGVWLDVIYPWDVLKLNAIALQKIQSCTSGTIETGVVVNGKVSIGKDTVIRSHTYIAGPVIIGENCEIGPNVCIMPFTSIADNVVVSPFTKIENSVLANNIRIGSGSSIIDSVIDSNCNIGAHFVTSSDEVEVRIDGEHLKVKVGATVGEYCNISECVILKPGAVIGNRSQIRPLKVIEQNLPDGSLVL